MSQRSTSRGTTQNSRNAERRRAAQLAVEAAQLAVADSGASATDAQSMVAMVVRRLNRLDEEAKVMWSSGG